MQNTSTRWNNTSNPAVGSYNNTVTEHVPKMQLGNRLQQQKSVDTRWTMNRLIRGKCGYICDSLNISRSVFQNNMAVSVIFKCVHVGVCDDRVPPIPCSMGFKPGSNKPSESLSVCLSVSLSLSLSTRLSDESLSIPLSLSRRTLASCSVCMCVRACVIVCVCVRAHICCRWLGWYCLYCNS